MASTGVDKGDVSDSSGSTGLLPLQGYMVMGKDAQTVAQAHEVLVKKCMARQGFTMPDMPVEALTPIQTDLRTRRYTAVASLADAKRFGFGWPYDTSGDEAARQASMKISTSLTAAGKAALVGKDAAAGKADSTGGSGRGGCVGEADKELAGGSTVLRGDGISPALPVRDLNLDPRSTQSPEVDAALKKFAGCMAAAGYTDSTDPRKTPDQFVSRNNASAPTRTEIDEAVAQVNCQTSSGVLSAMESSERAYQLKVIDQNAETFATIKAANEALVRHAVTVLGGS